MQTLGLSDSTVRSESRFKSLFWPSIHNGADVDYLAVQGFWVCSASRFSVARSSRRSLARQSRDCWSSCSFTLAASEFVSTIRSRPPSCWSFTWWTFWHHLSSWLLNSPGVGVVRIIIIALLLSNLRATWIAGNWKPESDEAALPPRLGDTFFDKLSDKWPAFIWPKVKVLYYVFSVGYLALIVAGLIVMAVRGSRF